MTEYDIVTVGGGLGGAALAKVMAERGVRVLVVERETQFKDRVRGEALAPWGVADAKELGIYDPLADGCGLMMRYWDIYVGGTVAIHRDLFATTPQQTGWLDYYHPAMQEIVLGEASRAGAEVRRGARVTKVAPGAPPRVTVESAGRSEEIAARLVVGADGRGSMVRREAGFTTEHDPPKLFFSGVLFENVAGEEDHAVHVVAPGQGLVSLAFPQPDRRARVYFGYHKDTGVARLQGGSDLERFRTSCEAIGFPADYLRDARPAGPLATFEGADNWVEHPYRDGVALLGDAAATTDPTWGQGMSLALRGASVMRDMLAANADWDAAGHAYADEMDRVRRIVNRADGWFATVFMDLGPDADELRARALPRILEDPTRICDVPFSGPETPTDETARRRFFGEE